MSSSPQGPVPLAVGPPEQPRNAPRKNVLLIQRVVRRYGATLALDGVSLEVRGGETLGLLGANGAGKTTLMHLLAGISVPDGGSIAFADGTDPCAPEARRRIGVAFQALAVYPELDVEENVAFFARLYGLHGRALRAAVDDALEQVGLLERRGSRARTLSGGMLRRLNLACAIVHRPEILLLDEPTAAVDPSSRAHLIDGLARIARSGTTLVLSTHHLDEAERLCDRVAILDRGRLVALGTPAELSAAHGGGLVEVELERAGDGRPVRLGWVGERPFDDVRRLLGGSDVVKRLRVESASLETVFFALTGRRLEG